LFSLLSVVTGFFGITAFTTKENCSSVKHNYVLTEEGTVECNAVSVCYKNFKNGALSNQLTDVGIDGGLCDAVGANPLRGGIGTT
jgi:hypothetical protein